MSSPRRWLGSIPPLLAGMTAAVAVETSAGVLLYMDDGLLPALTLILSVETGAFAIGLWSGRLPVGGGIVEQIRRRWMFSLIVFAIAAVLSAGLSFLGELPGSRIGQGIGLGFLGALPLFSIGSLLGALRGTLDGLSRENSAVGVPSAFGAALGFLLAGNLLLPNMDPYTLFLLCVVALSGGALLQGFVLDGLPVVETLEIVDSVKGELRVESRVMGGMHRELKVLLEGGRVRGAERPDGSPGQAWERGVLEAAGYLQGEGWDPESMLFLGGGSGTLPRLLSQMFPVARVHLVERSLELVRLARAHFREWDGWDRVEIEIGELIPPDGRAPQRFSFTVVDCGAMPVLGGSPFLRANEWRYLRETLAAQGILVLGGLWFQEGRGESAMEELSRGAAGLFDGVRSYLGHPPSREAPLLGEKEGMEGGMLILSVSGSLTLPQSLLEFHHRSPGKG